MNWRRLSIGGNYRWVVGAWSGLGVVCGGTLGLDLAANDRFVGAVALGGVAVDVFGPAQGKGAGDEGVSVHDGCVQRAFSVEVDGVEGGSVCDEVLHDAGFAGGGGEVEGGVAVLIDRVDGDAVSEQSFDDGEVAFSGGAVEEGGGVGAGGEAGGEEAVPEGRRDEEDAEDGDGGGYGGQGGALDGAMPAGP